MSYKLPVNIDELDASGDIRTIAEEAGAHDPSGATRRSLMKRAGTGAGFVAAGSALGLLSPFEAMAAATSSQKGAYSRNLRSVNRRALKPTANDVKIGNYALTLEYIEKAFYAAAVAQKYKDGDIAAAAGKLARHEALHVRALKSALGSAAVRQPKLNLNAVSKILATQESFVAVAATIEPVGTSAYAGAAPYLSNLKITKAALSIHSVEANHAAYLARLCYEKGILQPKTAAKVLGGKPGRPFDAIPLTFNPPLGFGPVTDAVIGLGVITGNTKSNLQP